MWLIYELLYLVGWLVYLPKALWRRRLPHRGWSMRLGRYPQDVAQRVQGRATIWVHAVSVGEVLAAQPLIQALATRDAQQPIVLSTITPGGFAVARQALGESVVPVYFPLDLRGCVRRAFGMMHPHLLLLMESELWPMVIDVAGRQQVPVIVLNGRVSPRAFRRAQRIRPWLQRGLHTVARFLMQTQEDADRLIRLGAPRECVQVLGNLKWEASLCRRPSPEDLQDAARHLGLNGSEPLLVAGSTHRGEEAVLVEGLRHLRAARPSLRLLLAPRHLERVAEVEGLIRQAGLTPRRVCQPGAQQGWDVGIVDTFGQLPRYYGLATVAVVGGSLIPHGGQNPLEPASLGKPIVFGPSMHNFAQIAQQLLAHRAAVQVRSGAELIPTLEELLAHPDQAGAMGACALQLIERSRGACQRTLDALAPLLPRESQSATVHQAPSTKQQAPSNK